MSTLFDLTAAQVAIKTRLDEILEAGGGEITPEVEELFDELSALGDDTAQKLNGYAAVMDEIASDAAAIRGHASVLKERYESTVARAKAKESAVDRLKKRITEHLIAVGEKKVDTGMRVFTLVKSGSLPVEIVGDVPDEFLRSQPDTGRIRDALKAGEPLDFAAFGEPTYYTRIR